jgi:hypothetical protein
MSNQRQILKGKSGGGGLLLWPALSPLGRRLPATSSNGSLEYAGNPRLCHRHRRPTAGVEHDELPVRTIAAGRIGSAASDRPTSSIL